MAAVILSLMNSAAFAYEALLEEDFGPDSEKYFFEGELDQRFFSYVDGEYEIDTTLSPAYGQSVVVENLETYRVETRGQLVSSTNADAGFGLSFNYRQRTTDNEFLLFLVYDRGAYTVLKYSGGRTTVLVTPQTTALFDPGSEVLLTVDSAAGQLACYINGAEVARFTEPDLSSGGVGMFATSGAVVRFDDFMVAASAPDPAVREYSFDNDRPLFEGDWSQVGYSYENGSYYIDTLDTEFVGLSPFETEEFDFEFAIDAELVEGDPINGFGIYIRDFSNPGGGFSQFRFLISGGWFAVERSAGERPLALSQWERHDVINENGTNRLKVVAHGATLRFIINGVEVWRGSDPQPQSGAIGLYSAAGIRVRFDNAVIGKR